MKTLNLKELEQCVGGNLYFQHKKSDKILYPDDVGNAANVVSPKLGNTINLDRFSWKIMGS